ncbi:MAG: hypothetical protein ACPIOQ_03550, partial [Promethearchaeia archaeon]
PSADEQLWRALDLGDVVGVENAVRSQARLACTNRLYVAKIQQRKMAMMTVQQIMADDGPALPDLHLPAEPLFDVVYRIPEASLKLARDDRQANLYYKRVREMINKGETKEKAQRIIGDAAWVNVSIQGRATNLLVTPSGQVLARNVVDKKSHGCGGI